LTIKSAQHTSEPSVISFRRSAKTLNEGSC